VMLLHERFAENFRTALNIVRASGIIVAATYLILEPEADGDGLWLLALPFVVAIGFIAAALAGCVVRRLAIHSA
jgi:hypothetical protein